ncbi:MAG TPA: response regulator [Herpetosiphonaceae bacterium]|nr:response regulator [Herpetosiphonaceae bacterium]
MTTILLLEDDVVLGQSLARALESAGLAVHIVCDGAGALSHLRDEQPDLVVVELMLPNLDGLSVCRRIRARSDVPIILLAPQSSDTNQIAALELGADDYIVKPVSESVVLARVRALLRRKDGARARQRDSAQGLPGRRRRRAARMARPAGSYPERERV